MQKVCKREQKGSKDAKAKKPYCQEHVDRLERPEENMSTGLVREGSSAHAMRAETQRTAPRQSTGSCNQSTGMNLSDGWNALGKSSRLVLGREFSS